MTYLIRAFNISVIASESGATTFTAEWGYIAGWDFTKRGGRGTVDFTKDPSKAKSWPNQLQAFEAWRQQSEVQPLRDDGEPNRPLTAYTVEIVALPDNQSTQEAQ